MLQNLLNARGFCNIFGNRHVHVGNVGKSGVTSQILDRIFSCILCNYKHLDVIIVMVGAGDVVNWLQSGAPSYKPASPMSDTDSFAWYPINGFSWSLKRSALAEIGRRIPRRDRNPKPRAAKWVGKARNMRAKAKEVRQSAEGYSIILQTFEKYYRSALLQAKAKASMVIAIPQPIFIKESYTEEEEALFWNGGIGAAHKEEIHIYYSAQVICCLMKEVNKQAFRIANELGCVSLDLMDKLEMSTASFYDQIHFTPAGSRVIADIIAETIVNELQKRRIQ
jgi:lysophospholipase L1-like esterase